MGQGQPHVHGRTCTRMTCTQICIPFVCAFARIHGRIMSCAGAQGTVHFSRAVWRIQGMEDARTRGRRLAREALARGDATGWFEELYATAGGEARHVQWADMEPNPALVAWLERAEAHGAPGRAVVVGCGLGDDAEELSRRGYGVVAFDVAPTAVAWCRRRFP